MTENKPVSVIERMSTLGAKTRGIVRWWEGCVHHEANQLRFIKAIEEAVKDAEDKENFNV